MNNMPILEEKTNNVEVRMMREEKKKRKQAEKDKTPEDRFPH